MSSIEVCAACLITDVQMIKITPTERSLYLKISGLQVKESKIMPNHFCHTCYDFLEQSKEFRKKCQVAHQIINQIHLSNGQLSKTAISLLDRRALGLEPIIYIQTTEIKVDNDQTITNDPRDPILNENAYEEAAIEIKRENEEKESVFVFGEPAATADDSDNDGCGVDDSMDAANDNPESSLNVSPADSKKKTINKQPLTPAERQKRYMARMKQDNKKYEKYKTKMRGYYHKRTKLINDLTDQVESYARKVLQTKAQTKSKKRDSHTEKRPCNETQVSSKLITFEDDSS